jgi:hypothetical protein
VPKAYNPKGLGLVLSGYCNKYRISRADDDLIIIRRLVSILNSLKSPGYSGNCWGYNFDWQARAFFKPLGTPTVVATSFIANALLDAYEILKDENLLKDARSSCDFILADLNRTYDKEGNFCFSYSPLDSTQVFNATALASKLLSRVYSFTNEVELKTEAKKSLAFCIPYQMKNGAWPYGTLRYHQWVDSFHTGYMIECLHAYQKFTGDTIYEQSMEQSFQYYLSVFFESSGMPKYYNLKRFPLDIHAPAQLIVTLYQIGRLEEYKDIADKVLGWVNDNMWDKRGFYYFQKRKWWTSRIPYMRWSQAWMFYSLSFYLKG